MINRRRRDVLGLTAAAVSGLAGCLGSATDSEDENDDETATDDAPEWRTVQLESLLSGETFAVEGITSPVVLHTFAVWCGSCRTQQEELDELYREIPDGVVGVELNADPEEDAARVREHIEANGYDTESYDWRFAIAPSEMMRGLEAEFGPKVLGGPASPVIVQCPDGEITVHDDTVTAATDIKASLGSC